jgi:superfamily I DNA/RNA helicase
VFNTTFLCHLRKRDELLQTTGNQRLALLFFGGFKMDEIKRRCFRALETPKRGIGDTAIREFHEYCVLVNQLWDEHHAEATKPSPLEVSGDDSWCYLEGAQFPPPSVSLSTRPLKLFKEFSSKMVSLRRLANVATVEKVLDAIVNDFGLIDHFGKISKSRTESEERVANVRELHQASRRYSDAGPCLLDDNKAMGEDEGVAVAVVAAAAVAHWT